MTTQFTIGDTKHTIPPLKFRELKAAAPFIDRVLDRRRGLASGGRSAEEIISEETSVLQTMTDSISDIFSVLAVGILLDRREYPYTPTKIQEQTETMEADATMEDINRLNGVFDDVLREAGLVRAAADPTMVGTVEGTVGVSPTESTESLQNSSLPDAPVETGTE